MWTIEIARRFAVHLHIYIQTAAAALLNALTQFVFCPFTQQVYVHITNETTQVVCVYLYLLAIYNATNTIDIIFNLIILSRS